MSNKNVLVAVKIPMDLKKDLAVLAKQQGLTFSAFVRSILLKTVDRKLRYKAERDKVNKVINKTKKYGETNI